MIYTFGDSWTAKWQEWAPWPEVLASRYNIPTKNFAVAGMSNQQILDEVIQQTIMKPPEEKVDHVIIAFTSIDRLTTSLNANVELCVTYQYEVNWYQDIQRALFKDVGIDELLKDSWKKLKCMRHLVKTIYGCDVTFIPVFEDCDFWRKLGIKHSFINMLFFMQHGRYLAYDAPVYEPGILQVVNEFATAWTEKHLNHNYERAYFERTHYIDNSTHFDDTLHPNQTGHDALAEYIIKNLNISRFSS